MGTRSRRSIATGVAVLIATALPACSLRRGAFGTTDAVADAAPRILFPDRAEDWRDGGLAADSGTHDLDATAGLLDAAHSDQDGALPSHDGAVPSHDASPGPCGSTSPCPRSCLELRMTDMHARSGVHRIDPDGDGDIESFLTYCDMMVAGGGWTLVMKAVGDEFAWSSPLWTNDEVLHPESVELDEEPAKLASFHTVPFTEVRLGLVDSGDRRPRWLTLSVTATSMLELMTRTPAFRTTEGRGAWLALTERGALQGGCVIEGVNAENGGAAVRLGIVADERSACDGWFDSFVGIGGRYEGSTPVSVPAVGNFAIWNGDDMRSVPATGYVMVR